MSEERPAMSLEGCIEYIEAYYEAERELNHGEHTTHSQWWADVIAALRAHIKEDEARREQADHNLKDVIERYESSRRPRLSKEEEEEEVFRKGRKGQLYDVIDGPPLLPCPFCGGEAKHYGMGSVACTRCHATCVNEFAADRWNRRAPLLSQEERHAIEVLLGRCAGYENAKATLRSLLDREIAR